MQHDSLKKIQTISTKKSIYQTPFLNVDESDVIFPDGQRGVYSVVTSESGFGGIAIPVAKRRGISYFGVVRQFRYPLQDFTREFPRGGCTSLEASEMQKELEEELGLPAQRIEQIGLLHADTGINNTATGIWAALMPSQVLDLNHLEEETGLTVQWMQEGELIGAISSGFITCGMTLAAYSVYSLKAASLFSSVVGE